MKLKYNNAGVALIKMLKEQKADFKTYYSTYTLTVEVNGEKLKFLQNQKSKAFFAVANKVQKDVKNADNYLNIYLHSLTQKKPEYFLNAANMLPFTSQQVFNLDLNSAYPSALLHAELITQDTFNRMMQIPKLDRLATIGTLGAKKEVSTYEKGKIVFMETIESRYRNIWKFVVNYIDTLMIELIELCKKDFIFYWVDGIYLKETPSPDKMEELKYTIEEAGLKFKTEYLKNFDLQRVNNLYKISYLKDGKKKVFEIPDKFYFNIKNDMLKV